MTSAGRNVPAEGRRRRGVDPDLFDDAVAPVAEANDCVWWVKGGRMACADCLRGAEAVCGGLVATAGREGPETGPRGRSMSLRRPFRGTAGAADSRDDSTGGLGFLDELPSPDLPKLRDPGGGMPCPADIWRE